MAQASLEKSPALVLPLLAAAGTIVSWAAAFPAIGFALREIEPLPLAAVRFGLAGLLALGWLAWRRPNNMGLRDYGTVLLCGLLGIMLYNLMLNSGQVTVSAGAASFIVNTQPIFMAFLAVFILKEAFNRWSWFGAALSFCGIALIASGQPGGFSFGMGSSLILAAAACAAIDSVLRRPLFARAAPLDLTALVLIAGALTLLPWLWVGLAQAGRASGGVLCAVIFLAVAPGAIGQACWTYTIKSFGAARAGQLLYLIPPSAVLLSWLILGEVPQWSTLIGGSLALLGVVVVNTWGRSKA